jgi:hypothetical protein
MSRPCNKCIEMCRKIGVVKVYYSAGDEKYMVERVNKMKMTHDSKGNIFLKKLKNF